MLNLLQQIVSFFEMVGNFIVNLVTGTFQMISLIPSALGFVSFTVAYLPPLLTTFIMAGVSLSVILLIVGRN